MTPALPKLRELAEAAIPPPWTVKPTSQRHESLLELGDVMNRPSHSRSIQLPNETAQLIVLMRNSLAPLLAVAEAAEKLRDELETYDYEFECGYGVENANRIDEFKALSAALEGLKESK